ncbi:hypothetical protein Pen01_59760 [Phytomonospora endophytica]|nr:hypothetical protein Pen01_59760 [Phytomonospora endophytica]
MLEVVARPRCAQEGGEYLGVGAGVLGLVVGEHGAPKLRQFANGGVVVDVEGFDAHGRSIAAP